MSKTFLDQDDAALALRPAVAVDLILMSVFDATPAALLTRRPEGDWALPGGFVGIDESLDAAARRLLASKIRIDDAYIEQLYTFSDVGRDHCVRTISVAYLALLTPARFAAALKDASDLRLALLSVPWTGEQGGVVKARSQDGETLPLAFDHANMLGVAVLRLRGKLNYSPVAFALLPERFTLRALQDIHEAILGAQLNKPAFRRRMLDRGWLQATGEREAGASFRPAALYRRRATV